MKYLLDTNACIQCLNQPNAQVAKHLAQHSPSDIAVCAVVKAELYYGAQRTRNPKVTLSKQRAFLEVFESLPFDDLAAEAFGTIRADLAAKGTPIGPYDLQIAAIAYANNLILITNNTKEFERVKNLTIEDWQTS